MVRSSFSQHNLFHNCPRAWYMQKVKNIYVSSDMCYADGGNVVHKVLEKWYNNNYKDIAEAKDDFNKLWIEKKLDNTKLALDSGNYWLMCLEGINRKLTPTSNEFKIFYEDIIAYLDAVDTNNDEVHDWKTSTRSEENEKEYMEQMKVYSWVYYRKFGKLPKKCVVHYVKYMGDKGVLVYFPTMEDVEKIKDWYNSILLQMEEIKQRDELPPKCESCFFFCPYKEICSEQDSSNYVVTINNNMMVLDGPLTPLLLSGIKKKFSYELKNAYFIKKHRPHANTTVCFFNEKKRCIALGFKYGLIKTLTDYVKFKKLSTQVVVVDNRVFDSTKVPMPDKFINGKELRDYQWDAVREFLGKKIGLLEIGTGGGKTEIAIECIRHLGCKTLFVVDKVELLKQTKKRIEESLGIQVGQIGYGVSDIKDVTVATIQTLIKRKKELSGYLNTVRFLIADECHHIPAKSYMQLSRYLNNTEYRLGITATAVRDDGNDMAINAVVGYKIFSMSSRDLIDKDYLMEPQIIFLNDYMSNEEVDKLENETKQGLINATLDYNVLYNKFIVQNEKRNLKIKEIYDTYRNKKILILVKQIEHGELLAQLLGCDYLHGSLDKVKRDQIMEEFRNDKNLLVGTISIFGEGLDIPSLDIIINASANRGNVRTIQTLGRALRKLEGKKDAYYFDFIDYSKFFKHASFARRKVLLKEGHEVIVKSQII